MALMVALAAAAVMFAVGIGIGSVAAFIATGVLMFEAALTLVFTVIILIILHFTFMAERGKYHHVICYPHQKLFSLVRGYSPAPVRKTPSLIAEYYKAKHDKICPSIEFVD
tara:strand:+ start:266 stop:598 length:333 start_codon:yes stop_codon:yes gene_type:complete